MTKKERYKNNANEIWKNILNKEKPKVDKEYKNFLINEVFPDARYLFMYRKKKIKYGYCTHCNTETIIDDKLRHKDKAFCKKCHSAVVCVDAGRGRSNLYHEHYITRILQSKRGGIILRRTRAFMDFRHDYKNILPTEDPPETMAYFEPNYYAVFTKRWRWDRKKGKWVDDYVDQPNAPSGECVKKWSAAPSNSDYVFGEHLIEQGSMRYCPFTQYRNSIHRERYNLGQFLQFYCEYPVLCERLIKANFASLIEERIEYDKKGGINLSKNTVTGSLGLNRNEIKLLMKAGCNPSIHYLKAIQWVKKSGLEITKKHTDFYAGIYSTKDLALCLKYVTIKQLIKITKGSGSAVIDYKDYVGECKQLKLDLTAPAVLLPSDLRKAHSRTSKLVREERDKAYELKLKQESEKFEKTLLPKYKKKFSFENNQYLIRPAESATELRQEGAALGHCVGGYAQRYLAGRTIILFIRKKSAPKKSFYTMEINSRSDIIQCRTEHNRSYADNPEISAFVDQWKNRNKKAQKINVA